MLLSLSSGSGWMLEEAVEASSEIALQAPPGFSLRLAFSKPPSDVSLGALVARSADANCLVEGAVELAVSAAVQSVPVLGLAGRSGNRRDSGESREGRLGSTADESRRGHRHAGQPICESHSTPAPASPAPEPAALIVTVNLPRRVTQTSERGHHQMPGGAGGRSSRHPSVEVVRPRFATSTPGPRRLLSIEHAPGLWSVAS